MSNSVENAAQYIISILRKYDITIEKKTNYDNNLKLAFDDILDEMGRASGAILTYEWMSGKRPKTDPLYSAFLGIWANLFQLLRVYRAELHTAEDYKKSKSSIVEAIEMKANNYSNIYIAGFASFFCGEIYSNRGNLVLSRTLVKKDFYKAAKYYKKADALGFKLDKNTPMHDFFDKGDETITADIENDPRLTDIRAYIRSSTAVEPEGQINRLKNKPSYGVQLLPKRNMKTTKGNTNNSYTTTNSGLTRRKNNLASENTNIIKRVWITVKDITRENDREGVIDIYDEILHLPEKPEQLTIEQTKLFVPTLPKKPTFRNRINPFKTFHKFTKTSNENITRKISVQNNSGTRSIETHEYVRRTQTPEMIKNYQIMAYNELIGLLLVLMEKANDKFLQENAAQRAVKKTGQYLKSFFRSDEAGIISLDTLSENYVQALIGYNMEENIRNAMHKLKGAEITHDLIGGLTKAIGTIIIGVLMVFIVYMIAFLVDTSEFHRRAVRDTMIRRGGLNPGENDKILAVTSISSFFKHTIPDFFTSKLSSLFINEILPSLIAEIALINATAGVFTAASLSYRVYKIYRSRKRAYFLKDIFKQIHITLFKDSNTHKFKDIKENVFFFKNISEKEKDLLLNTGSKINMQTSDKELSEYLSHFLAARKASLESKVIKTLANGNAKTEEALSGVFKDVLEDPSQLIDQANIKYLEGLLTAEKSELSKYQEVAKKIYPKWNLGYNNDIDKNTGKPYGFIYECSINKEITAWPYNPADPDDHDIEHLKDKCHSS